jgi:transcriptional regulator with XRE-family HTH domain
MMTFSSLREVREARNLTVGELSKKTGIAVANIKRIEEGTQSPTVKTIARLAEALDYDYDSLFSMFDTMKG